MTQNKMFHNILEELKRRRVFRVATLYVVAMWPIIQIADILSPALNLPADVMRTLLMVFISGFPIAIALTWIFNLTPKGITKVKDVSEDAENKSEQRLISKNAEFWIVVSLLLLAVSLFVIQGTNIETSEETDNSLNLTTNDSTSKIDSIAVLPFVTFSEKKEDEFFADGLSEELLNVLAKIKELRVVARTSSFAYKGVNRNIQEVGNELGVDAILEGSVRRNDVDNTIRVTAQLIDIKSGSHLWSETYDRKFNDIFKIQDEITAAVVSELKITLLGEAEDQLWAHESSKPEAMVAHSMGRAELSKRTGDSIIQAEKYFQKAIQTDPGYATAFASLAEAQILSIDYADNPRKEYREKAQSSVEEAIKLDPELGLAWAAQGLIYITEDARDDDAKASLEKAIELNPSYAMAYMWYGLLLNDDPNKQMEYYEKAFSLDPKSPVVGYNVANSLVKKGKDSEAMEVFSKIVEADPFYPGAYNLVAQINQYSGRVDQAIVYYKKSYDLGKNRKIAIEIADLYIKLGDHEKTREWMAIASDGASENFSSKLDWLEFAALLSEGNRTEAFDILENFKVVDKDNSKLNNYYRSVIANYFLTDYSEVVRQFELSEELREKLNMKEGVHQGEIDAFIYASYAYNQMEQFEKSNTLITMINSEHERITTSGGRISSDFWYQKSLIQSINGDEKMALITLQRAIDEGWSHPLRLSEEPMLTKLKSNDDFKAILTGLETRMSLMREQLAFEETLDDPWKG